jgi:hypothetical protein
MLKKADTNAVAPDVLEGARSATGSASGAAEVKLVDRPQTERGPSVAARRTGQRRVP